ncbi:hypothetical protein [Nocardioides soli]|uniref:Phage baseplate assembly protein W n=1 Tax=Nocardioides soli TaxID=1036020 RepID=A0A7W4Z102_9ACTN|nr:hypothetical protein [Nocardioides soli]MBB3041030.1 phage baseplate assembly protein W [Nocardioides soli]
MPRHLAFPLAVGVDGAMATLEQDAPAEVAQAVALLLSTEPGERAAEPEYGYPSPLGRGVDPVEVADVIADWEDRADPALVQVTLNTLVEQHAVVHPSIPTTSTGTDVEGA